MGARGHLPGRDLHPRLPQLPSEPRGSLGIRGHGTGDVHCDALTVVPHFALVTQASDIFLARTYCHSVLLFEGARRAIWVVRGMVMGGGALACTATENHDWGILMYSGTSE